MTLSREAIRAGLKILPIKPVTIAELGGDVLIRTISGLERDQFEDSLSVGTGKDRKTVLANIRAKLVALTVVDDQGNRLFTDADVDELGAGNGKALDQIFAEAQKHNGLTKEDVDDLAKKSASPGVASSSTLPSPAGSPIPT